MSYRYREYLQTLTIDDLKRIYPESHKVNHMFGKSRCNYYPRKRENITMIYYLILSRNPLFHFENAIDPHKTELSYNKHLNKNITKFGILYVSSEKDKCSLCNLKDCSATYYYYYPKLYDCYYPSPKIYDKDKQFEDRILCTLYMKRIYDFAEECIVKMYNILFYKYILFQYKSNMDIVNYIFKFYL